MRWDEASYAFARRELRRAFGSRQLTSLKVDQVVEFTKLDRNSGLPSLGRKSDDVDRARKEALDILHGKKTPPPCVAFYRTQVGKTRLVWGYPYAMTLLEGTIAVPVINDLRADSFCPYPVGHTGVGIGGRLVRSTWAPLQYCTDWSKFDSTVPRRVIREAFSLIRSWFVDEEGRRKVDIVEDYFLHCGILMPDGYVYTGRTRGIPSGSWLTQVVGSMCNYFLLMYIAHRVGDGIAPGVLVFGDDAVVPMYRLPKLRAWAKEAEALGMTIHPEKQVITHGKPHFLGHFWEGAFATRPIEETLQALATSERYQRFASKEEFLKWNIDKAKALIIDNPAAYHLLVKYIAWRLRWSVVHTYRMLSISRLAVHTPVRTGFMQSVGDIDLRVGDPKEPPRNFVLQRILH
uniref:RNA-dependent RNA polymerase n=1 Tax=Catepeofons virus TaxID=3072203 RepID=A0AA96NPC3_9VIRU|nr:MAG: RNA-dependent RNA polymerase [Catepeofons virus]